MNGAAVHAETGSHGVHPISGPAIMRPFGLVEFANTGPDNGCLFTILDGDNTGGVIFHFEIIREAADYGLYISSYNRLIDTSRGNVVPPEEGRIPPMPDADVANLREVTCEEMNSRVVEKADRDFRPGFLDCNLPGGGAQPVPVMGYGIAQNREHVLPITNPHGFSAEWLRLEPGPSVGPFAIDEKMEIIVHRGNVKLDFAKACGY